MHQTKKGNEWHFGMKVHIGVDSETGVVHSVSTTPANVHDVTETPRLLHGGETQVWGDAGYQGVHKRPENRGLDVEWQVAMRPGKRRKLEPGSDEAVAEKRKASVRAKVEHPFLYIKRHFDYGKVPLPWAVQEHAAADDAAGVRQLDESRAVLGGMTLYRCAQIRTDRGRNVSPRAKLGRNTRTEAQSDGSMSPKRLQSTQPSSTAGCSEVP